GASTGGTEAILAVLRDLPANMPGIVMVQHMPPVFTKMYAERLNGLCKVRVREAQDGDRVEPGLALLAAGDKQMKLASDANGYYVRCGGTDKVSGHCPSVDFLFDSVAKTAAANAIGIILTGMGADGAKGMLAMKNAGAYTIGQDKDSCVVYGMPMVAYNLGGVKEQLPLNMISTALVRRLTGVK
ncbi:CheB methylesterase domain-containing protein, partial [Ruminococcaceae bacterium OttesenSCG-928-L11]|nr:CheB methylesterase domain-containing protein [Ruminococcaceae bacterium OttesenSCG-928-L11]